LRIHDPACHDGYILRRLADALPDAHITFSDVDPHWVEACGGTLPASPASVQAGVPDASVDLLLLRALNRGVMTYAEALASLNRSVDVLRPGGKAIVYGYSFPLLNSAHFRAAGLHPHSCTTRLSGSPHHTEGVVPFYVLTKTPA